MPITATSRMNGSSGRGVRGPPPRRRRERRPAGSSPAGTSWTGRPSAKASKVSSSSWEGVAWAVTAAGSPLGRGWRRGRDGGGDVEGGRPRPGRRVSETGVEPLGDPQPRRARAGVGGELGGVRLDRLAGVEEEGGPVGAGADGLLGWTDTVQSCDVECVLDKGVLEGVK